MKHTRRYYLIAVAAAALLALAVWWYYHGRLKHIERQMEQLERMPTVDGKPE